MLKNTGPGGPPGYIEAPAPAGVTGVTTKDWATAPAPAPDPAPETDHTATAMPPPTPSAATTATRPTRAFLPLIVVFPSLLCDRPSVSRLRAWAARVGSVAEP